MLGPLLPIPGLGPGEYWDLPKRKTSSHLWKLSEAVQGQYLLHEASRAQTFAKLSNFFFANLSVAKLKASIMISERGKKKLNKTQSG